MIPCVLTGFALRELNASCRRATNHATALATESFANVRTIRAFGAEEVQEERYAAGRNAWDFSVEMICKRF